MYSIGIDIETTSRFDGRTRKSVFLNRLYTFKELCYCFEGEHASEHLAGRFAAKESVKKALATFTKRDIGYKDIEIVNDKFGMPKVSLKIFLEGKFNISVSISHTKDTAVAVAIATPK